MPVYQSDLWVDAALGGDVTLARFDCLGLLHAGPPDAARVETRSRLLEQIHGWRKK
jgi:hypothetical protein